MMSEQNKLMVGLLLPCRRLPLRGQRTAALQFRLSFSKKHVGFFLRTPLKECFSLTRFFTTKYAGWSPSIDYMRLSCRVNLFYATRLMEAPVYSCLSLRKGQEQREKENGTVEKSTAKARCCHYRILRSRKALCRSSIWGALSMQDIMIFYWNLSR